MFINPHMPLINRADPTLGVMEDTIRAPLDASGKVQETKRRYTLANIIARALDGEYPDDKALDPKVIYATRWMLATRILGAAPGELVEIDREEAATIKSLCAKQFGPGVWGQVWKAIDDAASAGKAPMAAESVNGAGAAPMSVAH